MLFRKLVFTYEDGKYKEGIRIYLNSQDAFADLDIDRFMQFVNIIKCTDMYNAALTMINYVKIPPYGINIWRSTGLGSGGYSNEYSSRANNRDKGLGYSNNDFLNNNEYSNFIKQYPLIFKKYQAVKKIAKGD